MLVRIFYFNYANGVNFYFLPYTNETNIVQKSNS